MLSRGSDLLWIVADTLRGFVDPSVWRMAFRNVGRSGRRSLIVVTAVSVGLSGAMLAMAFNYGMVYQMVETAIETELGDLQLHGRGFRDTPGLEVRMRVDGFGDGTALRDLGEIEAWAPRLQGEAIVFSPRASAGVRLVGIDPARESTVSVLPTSIVAGEYLDGDASRILIGGRLAKRLQVDVGDKVVVSAQDRDGDLTGRPFRIAGKFHTPLRGLDEGAVFIRLDAGQRMLGVEGEISELVVVARDGVDLDALRDRIAAKVGADFDVETWAELRPLLRSMITSFEQMAWVMYAAVFIAMAFGIANVLLMAVFERTREIGILLAIGTPPGRLVATIAIESLLLTLAGVGIGFAIAFGGAWWLGDGIDLSRWAEGLNAFGISARILPVLRTEDITMPTAIAIGTALVASLWPAVRAVRTRPAEAVRHV